MSPTATDTSESSESQSPSAKRSFVIESSTVEPIIRQQLYVESKTDEIKFYHQWTIENISYYCMTETSDDKYQFLFSSKFASSSNDKLQFCLTLHPNGRNGKSKNNLSVYLHLVNCDRNEIAVKYDFWIMDSDGDSKYVLEATDKIFVTGKASGIKNFCEIENILKSKIAPGNVLTIVCEICYDDTINESLIDKQEIALTKLKNDCIQLLKISELHDVVLVFGDGENKKEIPVHAAILGARSEVFAAMFEHNMKEKNRRRVEITDVGQELVNYLYCKDPFLDMYAAKMLPVADKYQLHSLKSMCEDALCFRINPESVGKLLLLADMHNSAVLKSKCIDYIHCHSSCVEGSIQSMSDLVETRPELYYELFKQIPQDSCLTWSPPTIISDPYTLSWSYTSSGVSKCSKLWTICDFASKHLSSGKPNPHDFIETNPFSSPNSQLQFGVKLYSRGENDDCKDHLSLHLQLKCDEKMKVAVKMKASIMVNDNSAKGYTLEICKKLSNGESIGWPKLLADVEAFEQMLALVYGQTETLTHWAHKMLPLVDKFELDSLRQVCQIALCDQLSDTNVAQFLLLADKHKATMLKAKAFEYIRRKHSVLTQNDSLKVIQQQNPKLFHDLLCYKLDNWKYLSDK